MALRLRIPSLLLRCHCSSSSSASASSPSSATDESIPPPHLTGAGDPSLNTTIRSLFKETSPDLLASRFKSISASSTHFRRISAVYSAIVRRLLNANRTDLVADVLESQKAHLTPPNTPSEGFAARLISLYGKARMADRAAEAFHQLPGLGCPRSALSFNVLLSAFSSAGEPHRVMDAFRSIPSEDPSIVPDCFSYNTAIHALCTTGEIEAAMGLLREMEVEKGIAPNVITFTTFLYAYYRESRFEEAEQIWAMMAERNCSPDAKCYNAKLRALAALGRCEEAAALLEGMKGEGVRPDSFSYTALIIGWCTAGDLEEAKKVFGEMRKGNVAPNRGTFDALVLRLCEAGEVDAAVKLCKDSMYRKCPVAAEVLQAVVDMLISASRVENAKKLVEFGRTKSYEIEKLKLPWADGTSSD